MVCLLYYYFRQAGACPAHATLVFYVVYMDNMIDRSDSSAWPPFTRTIEWSTAWMTVYSPNLCAQWQIYVRYGPPHQLFWCTTRYGHVTISGLHPIHTFRSRRMSCLLPSFERRAALLFAAFSVVAFGWSMHWIYVTDYAYGFSRWKQPTKNTINMYASH